VENARSTVDGARGSFDLIRSRRREDLPGTSGVEHASAHVPHMHGFVTAASARHDAGLAGNRRVHPDHVDRIEADIRFNVRIMSRLAEEKVPVVFSEPSCAMAVKMEYAKVLDSEETLCAARNCHDFHEFLTMLHQQGELNLDFGRIDMKVGYHNPCHLKAVGVTMEPAELLRLIPGVHVQVFSDQCCGIAGTFGLKKKNYDLSMAIGKKLFKEIDGSDAQEIALFAWLLF